MISSLSTKASRAFAWAISGALMLLPTVVLAQAGITPTTRPTNLPTDVQFGSLLTKIINWFLGIVGLIAVLMLVIGGFRYLTSAGNDEAVGKAKTTILYAIIGIVIVILSYAIVSTITTAFGVL
jgi:hypothetical protein